MLDNIAIVILNWNGKVFLEKFIPSLIKFSGNTKIYVADNLSDDDSISFLEKNYPSVIIIRNKENGGFAKGYNDALKHIKANFYILVNSDIEVTENWIDPIINLFESDHNIAAIQPKILNYDDKHKFEYAGAAGGYIDKYGYPFCRGRLFNTLETDQQQYNNAQEVFWATGACLFIKADLYWEVNGFDEDYFAHMEEIDLCWRLKNIGYKIFVEPKSTVYHVGGGTLNKSNPHKTFLNFRNNLITYHKNASSKLLFFKILFRVVLDGIAGIKFLLEGNYKHCFAVIKAHFAYYQLLPSTIKKRKQLQKHNAFKQNANAIYPKNIIVDYFLKGTKKFSDLKF